MDQASMTLSPIFVPSPIAELSAGAATITITLSSLLVNRPQTHWFAAVEFYSDGAGTHSVPSNGTVTITFRSPLLPNKDLSPPSNVITLSAGNDQVNWNSPVSSVKAVVAGVTTGTATPTHCRLRIFGAGV